MKSRDYKSVKIAVTFVVAFSLALSMCRQRCVRRRRRRRLAYRVPTSRGRPTLGNMARMCERGPCELFSSSFSTTAYSCEPRRSNSDVSTGYWSSPSQLTRSRNPCHSRTMAELYYAATAAYPKFAFSRPLPSLEVPPFPHHRMKTLGLNQKISCQSLPTRCMRRSP